VSREALGPLADRVSFGLRYEEGTRDELWRGSGPADRDALIAEMQAPSARRGELDLCSRTRSWNAEGRVRFHDRLDATLALPWVEREHRHMTPHAPFYDPRFVDGWTYDGLGDLTLLGHLRALGAAAPVARRGAAHRQRTRALERPRHGRVRGRRRVRGGARRRVLAARLAHAARAAPLRGAS
jgi:hypothetical protein